MWVINSLEIIILKAVFHNRDYAKKNLKVKEYWGAVKGFKDFQKRRFANGSSWIFQKIREQKDEKCVDF